MYLLDTNIIIKLLDGDTSIQEQLEKLPQGNLSLSSITYMELLLGIDTPTDIKDMCHYLDAFTCIPFSKETAKIAKKYFGTYKKRTAQKDVMIASCAIERHLTLITSDKGFPVAEELSLLII